MTDPIQSAIEASREREKKPAEGGAQSNDSLRALANDVGLITNPSLRIAASVASKLLRYRASEPRFREALAVAVEHLGRWSLARYPGIVPMTHSLDPTPEALTAKDAITRIAAILEGKP